MRLAHHDRSVTLAVVGGLEILAGLGLVALGVLTMVLVSTLPEAQQAMAGRSPIAALAAYPVLGVTLVVIGWGLIACRRWARALSILAAWGVAAVGLLLAITYAVIGPSLFGSIPGSQAGPAPPAGFLVLLSVGASLTLFFLPGAACAWALSGDDVRLTCEWRDRRERWTDRCPLPVLGLSILHAIGAIGLLASAGSPAVIAGQVVRGPAAMAFYAAVILAFGAVAWGTYHLRPWGWGLAVAVTVLGAANGLSILRADVMSEILSASGAPAEQVAMTAAVLRATPLWVPLALVALAFLGWQLAVLKHFRTRPS